jgi:hypothetical protein
MSYVLHDVVINPLPDRDTYIDLFTTALATPSDDELDAATPASWTANPYRLWVLALARELKAYATQYPQLPTRVDVSTISKNNRYRAINLKLGSPNGTIDLERFMIVTIVLGEAVNCILNGQPGDEVRNLETKVHLVIATTADGKYAGHITYYENEQNPTDLIFIAIYKSVYCKACPKVSEDLLNHIETKAKKMGKQTIHTRPIGPMADILEKHGFLMNDAGYGKAITGGRRRKTLRKSRKRSRGRSAKKLT